MRAGAMDCTIVVQRVATVVNAVGTSVETWSDLVTLRAQRLQTSTEEFIRAAGASDETVIVFRTWFYAGITNADRIQFAGQNFNLKEVKEIGRRAGLELRGASQ